MELTELDNLLKVYKTKIKPFIENGKYDEARNYISGLTARLLGEQLRANLTQDFSGATAYLPGAFASAKRLVNLLEEKDKDIRSVKRESRVLEMSLEKYRMGLEALTKK